MKDMPEMLMPRLDAQTASTDAETEAALASGLLSAMASVRRSARLLARRPLELSSLTSSQVDLVRLVRRRPGITVAEAAVELRLAPNTVSTLVRQLTAGEMIRREVDARDRRVAHLELTPELLTTVDAFRDRRISLLSAAIARLSERDRDVLTESAGVLTRLGLELSHLGARTDG
jgi:DNA-binding MarR family transcriptional regulator